MNRKVNTLIAVAVALGVVWLWNAGFFGPRSEAVTPSQMPTLDSGSTEEIQLY